MNKNQTKFSKFYYDSIIPKWKNLYINYKEIKKEIIESRKLIKIKFKTKILYKKNEEYRKIIDKLINLIIDSIKNIYYNFEELENNLISKVYKCIINCRNLNYDNNYTVSLFINNFFETVNLYNDLIKFITINLWASLKLIKRVNKYFNILENKTIWNTINNNLIKNDNILRKLIYCQRIFKCFFILKELFISLEMNTMEDLEIKKKLSLNSDRSRNNSHPRNNSLSKPNHIKMKQITKKGNTVENKLKESEINEMNTFFINNINLSSNLPTLNFKEDSINMAREESLCGMEINDFKFNINENLKKIKIKLVFNIDSLFDIKYSFENKLRVNIFEKFKKSYFIKEANNILNNENLIQEDIYIIDDREGVIVKECYSLVDLWIVLIGAFFYAFNYYGLHINTKDYLQLLNVNVYYFGLINASTPLFSFIFTFIFNFFTYNNYKIPYIICIINLILGNLLYFLSLYWNSLTTWILGKILIGIGGCKLLPRKYLTIMIKDSSKNKYFIIFVILLYIGLGLGPSLIYSIDIIGVSIINVYKINNLFFSYVNKFSILMILIWFIYLIIFLIFFEDNKKEIKKEEQIRLLKEFSIVKLLKNIDLNKSFYEIEKYLASNIQANLLYFFNKSLNLKLDIDKKAPINISKNKNKNSQTNIDNNSLLNNKDKYIVSYLNKKFNSFKNTVIKKYLPNFTTYIIINIIILNKIVQETFISEFFFSYKTIFNLNNKQIGYFFDIIILFTLIFLIWIYYISKKINQYWILIISMILLIILLVFKSNPFIFNSNVLLYKVNIWYYNVFGILWFILTIIIERMATYLLNRTINYSSHLGYYYSGIILSICDSLSRTIGNTLISVILFIVSSFLTNINQTASVNITLFILYLLFGSLNLIFMILILFKKKEIKKYQKISFLLRKKEEIFNQNNF